MEVLTYYESSPGLTDLGMSLCLWDSLVTQSLAQTYLGLGRHYPHSCRLQRRGRGLVRSLSARDLVRSSMGRTMQLTEPVSYFVDSSEAHVAVHIVSSHLTGWHLVPLETY